MPDLLWIPIGIAAALVYAFGFCVAWIVTSRIGYKEDCFLMALLWPIIGVILIIVYAGLSIYWVAEWFVDKVLKIK